MKAEIDFQVFKEGEGYETVKKEVVTLRAGDYLIFNKSMGSVFLNSPKENLQKFSLNFSKSDEIRFEINFKK